MDKASEILLFVYREVTIILSYKKMVPSIEVLSCEKQINYFFILKQFNPNSYK